MGGAKANKVRQAMERAEVLYTCPAVVAELQSKLTRSLGPDETAARVGHVVGHAVVIAHDEGVGRSAARCTRR